MRLNFCTLFDSNYSAKGVVMYSSLIEKCLKFHLYIFAFDNLIYRELKLLKLQNVSVISLSEFEDEQLLSVKRTRSKAEYCWTCTSSTILYCINKFSLDHCTYLDADLCFFSDPRVLLDEMGTKDVMITSHRYTSEFDMSETAGKYCVQFMTFKNTKNGLKVLNWWRDACIDWCYARAEDGKFGDQKYLDDWSTRFEGIHELEHLGGGVAPWNMQQYAFKSCGESIIGTEISSGKAFELVFFHFHAMLALKKGLLREFYFESYPLSKQTRKLIYLPYVSQLKKQFKFLRKQNSGIDGIATRKIELSWWKYCKTIRKRFLNKDTKYTYWFEI